MPAAASAGVDTSKELVVVTDLGGGDFSFIHGGFTDGAFVSGSFSGSDVDGDGQLSSFDGELTAFTMSFSGNALVGAFTLDFGDLFGLVYDFDGDIGDGVILDIEGIGVGSFPLYIAGPGPLAACDGVADCGLVDGPGPAPVPEPAAMALFGLGLIGLGAARRRRRH
jgi:hypothetical protein